MRQYGKIPPWNAASNTPAVSATTNLGTGGGAAVQTADSGGFGDVFVDTGLAPGATGSLALTFPGTPPALFIAGDENFGTVTQGTVGSVVTISWTGATLKPKHRYTIHYEWFNSNSAN